MKDIIKTGLSELGLTDKVPENAPELLARYGENHPLFHIDIPFTVERQLSLIRQAGFVHVRLHWKKDAAAIMTARKA